jgi:osmotically-inducible protein OsmY
MFAVHGGSSGFAAQVPKAWALGLAVLMLGGGQLSAASRAQVIAQSDSDCTLTAAARQMLFDDVELGTLNLGVSVNDRVATVWGAVPSEAAARRAVDCLRRVQGIARVVNQLSIEPPSDPLFDALRLPPRRPIFQSSPAGWEVRPPTDVDGKKPARTRTSLGPASLPMRGLLGDSQPVATQGKPGAQSAALTEMPVMPTLALPTRPAETVSRDLPHAIADLQAKNARLRFVRPEVRDHIVYLRGFVYTWEDVFALAREISVLPGVERVILQDVQTIRH